MHRVVRGQCVQGGKLRERGNVGCDGVVFDDESFEFGHDRGMLSMANDGRNRNGSQFFVCLKRCREWDGKHVVFGRVLSGLRVSCGCLGVLGVCVVADECVMLCLIDVLMCWNVLECIDCGFVFLMADI